MIDIDYRKYVLKTYPHCCYTKNKSVTVTQDTHPCCCYAKKIVTATQQIHPCCCFSKNKSLLLLHKILNPVMQKIPVTVIHRLILVAVTQQKNQIHVVQKTHPCNCYAKTSLLLVTQKTSPFPCANLNLVTATLKKPNCNVENLFYI